MFLSVLTRLLGRHEGNPVNVMTSAGNTGAAGACVSAGTKGFLQLDNNWIQSKKIQCQGVKRPNDYIRLVK